METEEQPFIPTGAGDAGGPLRRDPGDKVVAGVCGGLGRHFGIDPIIFRIGFVALTLAGAAGVVVYGLAWLFIPEQGQTASKAAGISGNRIPERTLGWGAGALAVWVLLSDLGDRPSTGGLAVALVLAGAAMLLLTRAGGNPFSGARGPATPGGGGPSAGGASGDDPAGAPVQPAGATPRSADGAGDAGALGEGGSAEGAGVEARGEGGSAVVGGADATLSEGGSAPWADPAPTPPAPLQAARSRWAGARWAGRAPAEPAATTQMWPPATRAVRPPKPPSSPLGRITVSLLAILGGVLLAVDRARWAHVSLSAFLSLALAGVGVALVLGAWWGRSRGLIVLGVLLAAAAAAATVIDVPLGAGVGDRAFRPVGVAEVAPAYELAVGELTVDLRDAVPAAGTTEVVTARVGVGHLVVLLPDDASVAVDGRVGAGELLVLGRSDEGTTIRSRIDEPGIREGAGRIELHVSAGAGQVEVLR